MKLPSLLGHSAQLLRLVEQSHRPADAIVSEYFRAKKYIGAKERRFISTLVFATLRGRSAFAFCVHEALPAIHHEYQALDVSGTDVHKHRQTSADLLFHELALVTACALIGNYVGVGNIFASVEEALGVAYTDFEGRMIVIGEAYASRLGIRADAGIQFVIDVYNTWSSLAEHAEIILASEQFDSAPHQEILAQRFAIPLWFLHAWQEGTVGYGDWFAAIELAASVLAAAPLVLRVNTLAADRESVLAMLRRDGINASPGKLSPDAIVINRRVNLTTTNLYKQGIIEIQDEASQLASFALAPEAGWRTLDACAGAGGKALHIGVLQKNQGTIVASDIEYQRLKELPSRAKRSGLSLISTTHLYDNHTEPYALPHRLEHLKDACDAVIVDAPCSGTGTMRRMPMVKWRLTPEATQRHARKQLELLQSFSHAVRDGGVLLYLTCSLMPQENIAVVQSFLDSHSDFMPDPLFPHLAHYGIILPGLAHDAPWITLTPALHGTDGFFIARLRKQDS
ncbi:MAG: RsmB/NOP family class I SAM-dependent RNA methyltransferase [Bacteroidota bacterium]|nr:RsmB/NOP family class I SAM-dependent RNA methyltransferase [Candidatus Kapabacteria bacterium]MDW8220198.1 RsmB/NOP family class I SAM-dependent RNA methyltransferase [Bacteroidota bacterium]